HGLPSSHAAAFGVCVQPVAGSQPSAVQGLPSSQFGPGPPTQTPPAQASPTGHALPSSHGPAAVVWTQPGAGAQPSAVHGFASSQTRGAPGTHAPALHASPTVQASPSSQAAVLLVNTQLPVAGSQASSVQGFASSHASGMPAHAPAVHVSSCVQ